MYLRLDDGTVWPYPDEDLNWKIQFGEPTTDEKAQAASIIYAYQHLIHTLSYTRRAYIIRQIKGALKGRDA